MADKVLFLGVDHRENLVVADDDPWWQPAIMRIPSSYADAYGPAGLLKAVLSSGSDLPSPAVGLCRRTAWIAAVYNEVAKLPAITPRNVVETCCNRLALWQALGPQAPEHNTYPRNLQASSVVSFSPHAPHDSRGLALPMRLLFGDEEALALHLRSACLEDRSLRNASWDRAVTGMEYAWPFHVSCANFGPRRYIAFGLRRAADKPETPLWFGPLLEQAGPDTPVVESKLAAHEAWRLQADGARAAHKVGIVGPWAADIAVLPGGDRCVMALSPHWSVRRDALYAILRDRHNAAVAAAVSQWVTSLEEDHADDSL